MIEFFQKIFSNRKDLSESERAKGDAKNAGVIVFRSDVASNELLPSGLYETKMDFSSGMAGATFAIYGVAKGIGKVGTWGVHDVVGVHGTAYKQGNMWCAGVHADVYDTAPGGTAIGVNVEFPQTVDGNETIGINIQPHQKAKGLIGIQLQHPETYKHGAVMPNMNYVFGEVDGMLFGFRFNKAKQQLEFIRGIGSNLEQVSSVIDMRFKG